MNGSCRAPDERGIGVAQEKNAHCEMLPGSASTVWHMPDAHPGSDAATVKLFPSPVREVLRASSTIWSRSSGCSSREGRPCHRAGPGPAAAGWPPVLDLPACGAAPADVAVWWC